MGAACSLACVCCVQKRNQRMFASVEDRQRKTRGAVEQTELERAYEQGFEAGVVEGYKRGTAESLRASPASVRSVDASQIAGGGPGREEHCWCQHSQRNLLGRRTATSCVTRVSKISSTLIGALQFVPGLL
eukprot:COSAG06_NODE_21226_length_765_cov_0.825826_2_plen_131_part_00